MPRSVDEAGVDPDTAKQGGYQSAGVVAVAGR